MGEIIKEPDREEPAGFWHKTSIRYTIFIYFTVSALVAVLLIGAAMYMQMSRQLTAAVQEENQAVLGQVSRSVDSYLRTIRKLSDSLYYGVIKKRGPFQGIGKQPDHPSLRQQQRQRGQYRSPWQGGGDLGGSACGQAEDRA